MKWLVSGGAIALVGLIIAIEFAGPSFILVAGLPIAIGVGVLRYRLYEIDRLISRTLSYAILTAVLVVSVRLALNLQLLLKPSL